MDLREGGTDLVDKSSFPFRRLFPNESGMRFFTRIAAAAVSAAALAAIAGLAGCAGPSNRQAIFAELNPAPMTPAQWANIRGVYTGPVRATTDRFGWEGQSTTEYRINLEGDVSAPEVLVDCDKGFSTSWTLYGERRRTYTNIPSRRYGTQGMVYATTHGADQVLLQLRKYGVSGRVETSLILTFRPNGHVSVEFIGPSGWHGDGELWRVPALLKQL
jgi:hypothetical protein